MDRILRDNLDRVSSLIVDPRDTAIGIVEEGGKAKNPLCVSRPEAGQSSLELAHEVWSLSRARSQAVLITSPTKGDRGLFDLLHRVEAWSRQDSNPNERSAPQADHLGQWAGHDIDSGGEPSDLHECPNRAAGEIVFVDAIA